MELGTKVQFLDATTGSWTEGTVEDYDMFESKAMVKPNGRGCKAPVWVSVESIKKEVANLMKNLSNEDFQEICRKAFTDRRNCTPAPNCKTPAAIQRVTVTLLETLDMDQELSEAIKKRMAMQDISFNKESFLRSVELFTLELEKLLNNKGHVRQPRQERLLCSHLSVYPVHVSRSLRRGDKVFHGIMHLGKWATIKVNDPFTGTIQLDDDNIICYEDLQRSSTKLVNEDTDTEDEYDLHLTTDTASDDSAHDPSWEPRDHPRGTVSQIETVPKRKQLPTKAPAQVKKRQTSANKFQILAIGEPRSQSPVGEDLVGEDCPQETTEADTSTASACSGSTSGCSGNCTEEIDKLRKEMDRLREEVQNLTCIVQGKQVNGCSNTTAGRNPGKMIESTDFWKLRPIDLPSVVTDETIQLALKTRRHADPVEEAKKKGSSSRKAMARDLFCTLFTLGEIYNRNVKGIVKSKAYGSKKPMDESKINILLSTVGNTFPTPAATLDKECITAVNDYNRGLWSRRFKDCVLPPFHV